VGSDIIFPVEGGAGVEMLKTHMSVGWLGWIEIECKLTSWAEKEAIGMLGNKHVKVSN